MVPDFKTLRPSLSDLFPSARPHLLSLPIPSATDWATEHSNVCNYGGHLIQATTVFLPGLNRAEGRRKFWKVKRSL